MDKTDTRRKLREAFEDDEEGNGKTFKTDEAHRRGRQPEGTSLTKVTQSRKQSINLPARWSPRFWEDSDQRLAVVRQLKARIDALAESVGADSVQKRILCSRAGFLDALCESIEVRLCEGDPEAMEWLGRWTQAVNALSGCFGRLGMERHQRNVTNLKSYINEKRKKRANGD